MITDIRTMIASWSFLNERLLSAIAGQLVGGTAILDWVRDATEEQKPLDDRIRRLEEAKAALQEGLEAVAELQDEALRNKSELGKLLADLDSLRDEKEVTEQELSKLRALSRVDTKALRRVVGMPSEPEKNRDRVWGFVSGVTASIVAWLIITLSLWIVGIPNES